MQPQAERQTQVFRREIWCEPRRARRASEAYSCTPQPSRVRSPNAGSPPSSPAAVGNRHFWARDSSAAQGGQGERARRTHVRRSRVESAVPTQRCAEARVQKSERARVVVAYDRALSNSRDSSGRFTLRPSNSLPRCRILALLGSALVRAARPFSSHPRIVARTATESAPSLSGLLMRVSELPHLAPQKSQVPVCLTTAAPSRPVAHSSDSSEG